jgi:hypothetical protein
MEIPERSCDSGRPDDGTFEDIVQIVVMVFVKSANGQDFLESGSAAEWIQ